MQVQGSPNRRPLIIDGLSCAALTRDQVTRTLSGGVSVMNLTATRPAAGLEDALIQLEIARKTIGSMSDIARIVTTVSEIEAAHNAGLLGVILGAQNSLMVQPDIRILASFKSLGMRILQPTYNERNAFGYGAPYTMDGDGGITESGRAWLAMMESLGLLVDLSHCGHRTSADYIGAAKAPMIFSHANAYAVCPSPRNKTDELVRGIAKTGGLIGAVTWAPIVRFDARPTIDDYVDHVSHLVKVGGVDHVAFASDLPEGFPSDPAKWERMWGKDGLYPNITGVLGDWYRYGNHAMKGMETITEVPAIWDKMRSRGFHESEIEKIASGNWMRVLREVWSV